MGWTRATGCVLCFQIAYLRVLGFIFKDIPDKIQTEDHPNGCSYRHVFNHVKDHSEQFDPIQDWMNLYKREKGVTVKELSRQTIRDEMESTLGQAFATVKEAILDGDADKAIWLIEQAIGKPTQTTKHTGAVAHGHMVFDPQSVRLLAAQEVDMINSDRLLKQLPAGIIELTPIEFKDETRDESLDGGNG